MNHLLDVLRAPSVEHGFFLRSDAIEAGLDDAALRRGLRNGSLVRIRQGAYAFADTWEEALPAGRHLTMARAVARQSGGRVAASHHTGVLNHGLDAWEVPLDRAHVTRLDGGAGRVVADAVHHEGLWLPEDLTVRNGMKTMRAERAALESAMLLDVEHGLCVVDSGLRAKLFTEQDLLQQAKLMQSWPDSQHLEVVTRMADGRSESVGESRSRHLFWRAGLPAPELQYQVIDGRGLLVGVTDFAWPHLGLMGEFDGKVKYGRFLRPGEDPGDAVFREKQREDLLRRVTDWRMVRITWSMLYRPPETAALIRSMMRAAA